MAKQLSIFDCLSRDTTIDTPSTSTAALHESNIHDEEILEDEGELSEEELAEEDLQTPEDSVQAILVDCSEPFSVSASGTSLMGNQTGKIPHDIAASISESPRQPKQTFPSRSFGKGRKRSFNVMWYKTYPWLEYSASSDACFCYPCRFFRPETRSGRAETAFTVTGYRNWKNAIGKAGVISRHNECQTHRDAMLSWEEYKRNSEKTNDTSIEHRLNSARMEAVSRNRHYIVSLIEILILCATENLALRGHRESPNQLKQGNFRAILSLLANHDSIIAERLRDGPNNALYTSPQIQNDLLCILGNEVRGVIAQSVQKSVAFSLMVDECKDVSKVEQLAIVLRYVDLDTASIFERLLCFFPAENLNADSISTYILDTLSKHNLEPKCIVSQGYDGASVMSGAISGVQTRIKRVAPYADYVHCNAHCLNLCLVDTVKGVKHASEFFALVESLYIIISTVKVHTIFMKHQTEMHPGKQHRQLHQLSDTRWTCRHDSINAICYTFDAILKTLESVADGNDGKKAAEAKGLLLQIKSFQFVLSLNIFDRILTCSKLLSDALQSTKLDLGKAADLVTSTIGTLEEFRTDTEWMKVLSYSKRVCNMYGIPITEFVRGRSSRPPTRYDDDVIHETTGMRDNDCSFESYKVNLYYSILDTFLHEIKRRFTDKNQVIMRAIQACCPTSSVFFDIDTLEPMITAYDLNLSNIAAEVQVAKRMLIGKDLQDVSDVLLQLVPLKEAFPALIHLLRIALTICVTTAKCERTFSCLKLLKNYLRSTMSQGRLNDLAVMAVESDIVKKISIETIVNKFAQNNRRLQLV